jgi:hypothetical protein
MLEKKNAESAVPSEKSIRTEGIQEKQMLLQRHRFSIQIHPTVV